MAWVILILVLAAAAFGVLGAVNGLGDFLSSTVVGFLWWGVRPVAGFAYAAVLMLVGAGLLHRVR